MEEHIDFSGQAGFKHTAQGSGEGSAPQAQHFNYASSSSVHDPSQPAYLNTTLPQQMSCDIKPRLTKEQHDILENHFQQQHKPNTNTKKGFAEHLGVSLDKVNVSFDAFYGSAP